MFWFSAPCAVEFDTAALEAYQSAVFSWNLLLDFLLFWLNYFNKSHLTLTEPFLLSPQAPPSLSTDRTSPPSRPSGSQWLSLGCPITRSWWARTRRSAEDGAELSCSDAFCRLSSVRRVPSLQEAPPPTPSCKVAPSLCQQRAACSTTSTLLFVQQAAASFLKDWFVSLTEVYSTMKAHTEDWGTVMEELYCFCKALYAFYFLFSYI